MSELHDGTIDSSPTRVLLAVGQCTKGYPYPSRSSEHAFNWVLEKLIPRSCRQNFRLLILHVLAPDEDGMSDLPCATIVLKKNACQTKLKLASRFRRLGQCLCNKERLQGEGKVGSQQSSTPSGALRDGKQCGACQCFSSSHTHSLRCS